MPTLLQASIKSVPAGAVTFFPSTVMFTSAMETSSAGVPPAVAQASSPAHSRACILQHSVPTGSARPEAGEDAGATPSPANARPRLVPQTDTAVPQGDPRTPSGIF